MSVKQITVPYRLGYDFGIGADLPTGSPMGLVVEGEVSPVSLAPAPTVDFQVQRITATEELETALGISADASYGCGAFGAGISARFNFAKSSKIQSNSLFMTVSAVVQLGFVQIDDPKVRPAAATLVGKSIFTDRFGNMFVRGIARGGLFMGVLRIETTSAEESTSVSAELEGSYGLFSADAQVKFKEVQSKYKTDLHIRMYHEGGPVDLKITDPANPLELLNNVNLFLQSFKDSPDTAAVPYMVTLAPIEIADAPPPANAADIQHGQDVIVDCAKRRSAMMDHLNLLEFIDDNQSKYDFANGASATALQDAIQGYEADLDLVAHCASAAINDPKDALFPASFAEKQPVPLEFPRGKMPNPMPTPKAGKIVDVPSFMTCHNWSSCKELAALRGLVVDQQIAPGPEEDDFKVLGQTPSAGESVLEGSKITVVTNHQKAGLLWRMIAHPELVLVRHP